MKFALEPTHCVVPGTLVRTKPGTVDAVRRPWWLGGGCGLVIGRGELGWTVVVLWVDGSGGQITFEEHHPTSLDEAE